MRTIEEVLTELRSLHQRAKAGENVTGDRQRVESELQADHGIVVDRPGGSRFKRANLTREEVAAAAANGQVATKDGRNGRISGIDLLMAVRAAKAGDPTAHRQLASVSRVASEAEKTIVGGGFLIAQDAIPGFLEALAAANPLRALCTEHEVSGREVRMIVEGDDVLVTEHVPEGGTKPSSNASVVQVISTVHKAAGVTDLPDELVEDSNGAAEDIVGGQFARSIGETIDVALADGTGVGQPLGILRHPDVDHTPVADQTAMALYAAITKRITALKGRFLTNLTVVLHPDLTERFDLDLDNDGNFRWPDGLDGKLTGRARVVEDAHLPVAVDGTVPVIVGAFKRGQHFFSRKALVIEQSNAPGFTSDETTFRAVERYGAVVAKPSCFEVIDGADLTA